MAGVEEAMAEIEKAHTQYEAVMQAALVLALGELRDFYAEYKKLPKCVRKIIEHEVLKELLQAPFEDTRVRLEAKVDTYTCRVSHLDEGERALERQALEFLEDMEEAGVVRAERVLALVEAIERRVEA